MKTFLTGLLLILSTSAFAQSISWSQWYALTGKNKLVTTDANGEPSGALGTVSGTNAAFIGGISANNFKVTNFTTIQNATASKVAVFDSLKNLTNAVLTTGTIPVASTSGIGDGPVYVTSVTNANVIGGLSADTVDATNGIKSAGTSYIGFGSGAISLTGRLAVSHITNVTDLASATAISQVLSGTNTEFIGAVTADNVHATNGVTSGGFVLKNVALTQGVSPLADSTNQVLDFSQGMYQTWVLTNDICLTNFTGAASAATIKFRPNGANRNVLIDTNWMPVNVQGGTLNGTHYQFVVTNGTQFAILSAWASGANATNVAAVFSQF